MYTYSYPYYQYRDNADERGALLPFLAGVLVASPFIFLNKNNQNPSYAYAGPMYGYPPYNPYPVQYPYQPYAPQNPYIAYASR